LALVKLALVSVQDRRSAMVALAPMNEALGRVEPSKSAWIIVALVKSASGASKRSPRRLLRSAPTNDARSPVASSSSEIPLRLPPSNTASTTLADVMSNSRMSAPVKSA
jgi:hypothetical protein